MVLHPLVRSVRSKRKEKRERDYESLNTPASHSPNILVHDAKDATVAYHDNHTRNDKGNDEHGRLAAASLVVRQYRAGTELVVVTEFS